MLREVLQATEEHSLKPICFSSDGQFINLITKDFEGQPLTLLQMQKQHWQNVTKIPKAQLLCFFRDLNQGKASVSDISSAGRRVKLVTMTNGQAQFTDVHLKKRHRNLLNVRHKSKNQTAAPEEDEEISTQAQALLPDNLGDKVDRETFSEIMHIVASLLREEQKVSADEEVERSSTALTDDGSKQSTKTLKVTTRDEDSGTPEDVPPADALSDYPQPVCSLEHKHFAAMLCARDREKWSTLTVEKLQIIFSSADVIDKRLLKDELKTCCRVLKAMLPEEFKDVRLSAAKNELLSALTKKLGRTPVVTKKKSSA
jgi:hypothetical protein